MRVGWESSRNSCQTFGRHADAIIVTSHLTAPMAGTDYCVDSLGIVGGMLCPRNIEDSISFSFRSFIAVYLIEVEQGGSLAHSNGLPFMETLGHYSRAF